jgi:hypothetical protein
MSKARSSGSTARSNPHHSLWRDLRDRLALGLAIMLLVMGGFVAFVTIQFLFRGEAPFDAHGTTYGTAILTYAAAGVLGGILLGLALPLTRWRWGSAVAGAVAFVPFYGSVMVAQQGPPWGWDRWDIGFAVGAGLLMGGILGYLTDRSFSG